MIQYSNKQMNITEFDLKINATKYWLNHTPASTSVVEYIGFTQKFSRQKFKKDKYVHTNTSIDLNREHMRFVASALSLSLSHSLFSSSLSSSSSSFSQFCLPTQTLIQSFDSSVVVCSVLTPWIYIVLHIISSIKLLIQTRVYKLFCSSYNLFIIKIRSRAVCARIAYSFHACFLPFNHSLCLFVNKLVCVCVFSSSFYARLRSMNYSVWICKTTDNIYYPKKKFNMYINKYDHTEPANTLGIAMQKEAETHIHTFTYNYVCISGHIKNC